MNHLPFTLTAYLFNAFSVLASKFLLNKTIPDPLVYIFYISLISILAIFALPFTHIPSVAIFNLASLSTLLWTLGAYLMFKALKIGHVSRVVPVIGTLIPLILLITASGTNAIATIQAWAILILILGMVFLSLQNLLQRSLSKREIIYEVLSAGSFALSYIILRQAYLGADFFSVLVWSRLILLPLCFLLLFSISLANPALVNSLQGSQYAFLFILAIILGKKYPQIFEEKYTLLTLIPKIIGIILITLGLYLLSTS